MMEAVLTITPRRFGIMWRAAARAHKNTPVRLTLSTASQSARLNSSEGRRIARPALFTRLSMRPSLLAIAAMAASTADSSLTSTPCAAAKNPCALISSATVLAALESRSNTCTRAPARAMPMAMPRPIPLPPPVITATLPSSEKARCGSKPANDVSMG